ILVVLAARFVAVGVPVTFQRPFRDFSPHAVKVLTWGGLRGGISVALALSLPLGPERDVILTMTYVVVAFSILVQGLTLRRLLRGWGLTGWQVSSGGCGRMGPPGALEARSGPGGPGGRD